MAGEAKQAATAAPPAAKPEDEMPAALYGISPREYHSSVSSLASSTDEREIAEKAKHAVTAAAAPQPKALRESDGKRYELKAPETAGAAKQRAVQAAAKVAESATVTGIAATGAPVR